MDELTNTTLAELANYLPPELVVSHSNTLHSTPYSNYQSRKYHTTGNVIRNALNWSYDKATQRCK